ncbi:MAG: hypothetical protein ACHQ0J_15560 [Candidatus Dormibacterales bacterium]
MKRTIWAASLLVSLLVVLTPMAWASPIDPTWIQGVYDDADFDDVVMYLTSGTVAIPVLHVRDPLLILVFAPVDPAPAQGRGASPPPSSHPPRAPPLG